MSSSSDIPFRTRPGIICRKTTFDGKYMLLVLTRIARAKDRFIIHISKGNTQYLRHPPVCRWSIL